MTLLAALLLERRVILVAKERDTVSAAVHAAAALLYPFRWQHIYLPLLPIALKVWHNTNMERGVSLQVSGAMSCTVHVLQLTALWDLVLLHHTAEQAICMFHAVMPRACCVKVSLRKRIIAACAVASADILTETLHVGAFANAEAQ